MPKKAINIPSIAMVIQYRIFDKINLYLYLLYYVQFYNTNKLIEYFLSMSIFVSSIRYAYLQN